jgi:hypothetical protein
MNPLGITDMSLGTTRDGRLVGHMTISVRDMMIAATAPRMYITGHETIYHHRPIGIPEKKQDDSITGG